MVSETHLVKFVGDLDRKKDLKLKHIDLLVIHRLSLARFDAVANPEPIPDDRLTGKDILKAFTTNKHLGTGCKPGYHFVVLDGHKEPLIEQMIPLKTKGMHSPGYNWRSIAIAVVGDFNQKPPEPGQMESLERLCRVLAPMNDHLMIAGHTELPGASNDPLKVCPGRYFDLVELRSKTLICRRPAINVPLAIQEAGIVL